MKLYKVEICGSEYELDLPTLKSLLTERAFKLFWRVKLQGGVINFNMNSIRKELRNEES